MDKQKDFSLSPWDKVRSRMNELFFAARTGIAFSRNNYSESCAPAAVARWKISLDPMAQAEAARLAASYGANAWIGFLSVNAFRKNIETFWILEQMLLGDAAIEAKLGSISLAVDAGAQDFARLPALAKFLREGSPHAQLVGVELDAYPPLARGHSRADIASHYCRNIPQSQFLAENFFEWKGSADFVAAFYPFVSPHPALAWGLPKRFGDAGAWVSAITQALPTGGLALVVHQGDWEEREFDTARAKLGDPLKLLRREALESSLLLSEFPANASVYARK